MCLCRSLFLRVFLSFSSCANLLPLSVSLSLSCSFSLTHEHPRIYTNKKKPTKRLFLDSPFIRTWFCAQSPYRHHLFFYSSTGRTFTKVGHPHNQIILPPPGNTTGQHDIGEGDHSGTMHAACCNLRYMNCERKVEMNKEAVVAREYVDHSSFSRIILSFFFFGADTPKLPLRRLDIKPQKRAIIKLR